MPQQELEQLMEKIEAKYPAETVSLRIGDRILKILQIREFEKYFENLIETKSVGINELPYWARVWETSFMLALFLEKQPVVLGRRILEIGAGIGIVGIYAALAGHNITVTDNNEDALLFARANALMNGCPGVKVRKLDWKKPDLPHRYDVIVGSEVIYDRESYPELVRFLREALAPGGIIFLAKSAALPAPTFLPELTKYFKFKEKRQTLRSNDEPQDMILYAIRPKE